MTSRWRRRIRGVKCTRCEETIEIVDGVWYHSRHGYRRCMSADLATPPASVQDPERGQPQ